jgi:hypothetical protein
MEALAIASVVLVAAFVGRLLQPLTMSSGYRPVLGSLVV